MDQWEYASMAAQCKPVHSNSIHVANRFGFSKDWTVWFYHNAGVCLQSLQTPTVCPLLCWHHHTLSSIS